MMMKISSLLLLSAHLLNFCSTDESVKKEVRWNDECPDSCSCSMNDIRDVPIYQWYSEEASAIKKSNSSIEIFNDEKQKNYSTYLDFTNMGLLRTAVCMLQRGIKPDEWIASIPRDVQVLTLLQSLGSEQLTLKAEHFKGFSELVALEVRGSEATQDPQTAADKDGNKGGLVIMSGALRGLNKIIFLHLQKVRLIGQPEEAPKPINTDNYKYVTNNEVQLDKDWKQKHTKMLYQLIFLSNSDPLPYNEYKVAQERAGLSLFKGLSNLVFLRVYDCGLKEITWEMFEGLTSLQFASLDNNDLHFVPDFAFYGAPNLKVLSLSRNKILNLQFVSLSGLLELERIDLSNNNISHLSEVSLPPLPKLRYADFRYNPIERIFPATFEIMNRTESIYIGNSDVAIDLKQSTWSGLLNLKRLSIFNAKTPELELEMLKGMPKLKELEIQGKIASISFDAFLSAPKLEILILKSSGIEHISMDSFYGLHGLLALDLSHNLLTTLPPGIFDQLYSLKELQLQNNRLKELPDKIFSTLNAKMIRLEHNPWHCSCSMREWRPMAINKVKIHKHSLASSSHYSKALIPIRDVQYIFEKRVAPKCRTPTSYLNWNVFHVLRKELRCGKIKGPMSPFLRMSEKYFKKLNSKLQNNRSLSDLPSSTVSEEDFSSSNVQSVYSTSQPTSSPEQSVLTTVQSTSKTTPPISAPAQSTTAIRVPSISTTTKANEMTINFVQNDAAIPLVQNGPTAQAMNDQDSNNLHIMTGQVVWDAKPWADPQSPDIQTNKMAKKTPFRSDNTYFIIHDGKPVKVSKKAYKLEIERLRLEQLKHTQQ